MKPKPSIPGLLRDLRFAIAVFAIVFLVTNCAPQVFHASTPNPLDTPGEVESTAAELHDGNISIITDNPAY